VAQDFIERAIETDRSFLEQFDPERDLEAFERAWRLRQTGATAEVHAFEPNYEGSPIVVGSEGAQCSAVGSHVFKARTGHHLAPQPLSTGRNVFDELGSGYTLLALDVDDAVIACFERTAAGLGIPFKVVRDTRSQGREKYDARLVLIRPDEFVAWASNDAPKDPGSILRQAVAAA
jgi:hypothetical protein